MALRIATRGSALARWQAEHVARMLGGEAELVVVETAGDRIQDRPISELGGRGVFVKEVQNAVLAGRADVAVHSAKDLPARPDLVPAGLVIGAVPPRGDPRDAMVGLALDDIPSGGVVATGSSRRRAQLADLRPDLSFADLRGNIPTRLDKAGQFSAIVVALAALQRLGLDHRAAEVLEPAVMLPQIGQGTLAVECRADDDVTLTLLAAIDHAPSRRELTAERGFLAELGGGCELPVAAYATADEHGSIWLRTMLASMDGRQVLRLAMTFDPSHDAAEAGAEAGRRLLGPGGGSVLLSTLEL